MASVKINGRLFGLSSSSIRRMSTCIWIANSLGLLSIITALGPMESEQRRSPRPFLIIMMVSLNIFLCVFGHFIFTTFFLPTFLPGKVTFCNLYRFLCKNFIILPIYQFFYGWNRCPCTYWFEEVIQFFVFACFVSQHVREDNQVDFCIGGISKLGVYLSKHLLFFACACNAFFRFVTTHGAPDTWRSRDLRSAECASLTTRILHDSPLQSATGVWTWVKKKKKKKKNYHIEKPKVRKV